MTAGTVTNVSKRVKLQKLTILSSFLFTLNILLPTYTYSNLATNHIKIAWTHACAHIYLLRHKNIGHHKVSNRGWGKGEYLPISNMFPAPSQEMSLFITVYKILYIQAH